MAASAASVAARAWTTAGPSVSLGPNLAVHHVDVQASSHGFDGLDRGADGERVGGDDRRGDVDRVHRLTSSEIASPGATWKPARGLWRSTMLGAMPGYG